MRVSMAVKIIFGVGVTATFFLDRVRHEGMWDKMEKSVAQEPPGGKAEQQFQQRLVLGSIGLHRNEEKDEERGRTDQQRCTNGMCPQLDWVQLFLPCQLLGSLL